MKRAALFVLIVYGASMIQPSRAQQATPDVLSILRASLVAQAGQNVVQDVTLTGSVESISGSDDETVPFAFRGTLSGSARTDIQLSSGTLTEIRMVGADGVSGTWSAGDGKSHVIAGHNLLTEADWCSPLLIVERLLATSAVTISYLGTEGGLAHFSAYQPAPAITPTVSSPLVRHLSQIELYLDPKSFLPAKISFNAHPDDNALSDIPVSVEYANYQQTSGVIVPLHIQRYFNGSLALDIQVGSVAVNSGLSAANF